MNQYYVYIMTNRKGGVPYIGITNDLVRRAYEHKQGYVEGFTKRYNLHSLVYYEVTDNVESAIHREKRLKKYRREAKVALIEKENPNWLDLYDSII